MRLVYLQPFVTSAQRILEEVVSEGIVTGDVRLASAALPSRGVTAIVGLPVKGRGRFLFDMDRDTALKIASAMNGEPIGELEPTGAGYAFRAGEHGGGTRRLSAETRRTPSQSDATDALRG